MFSVCLRKSLVVESRAKSPKSMVNLRSSQSYFKSIAWASEKEGTIKLSEDQTLRRKLKWRSMERGMKENEIIFRSFIAKNLETMPAEVLPEFEELLDLPDPDLYKWLSGSKSPPEDVANTQIWKMVREHIDKEILSPKL